MTILAKIGAGALTIGTVGGVGYGIVAYSQEQGTPISQLIKTEFKYVLLDTTDGDKDSTFWQKNWDNYNKENTNNEAGQDPLKLTGWKKSNTQDLTVSLKEACRKASEKSITNNDDPIYAIVTKYCTRGVTVKEDAESKKREILKTDGDSAPSTVWAKRAEKKADLKNDLSKLGVDIKVDSKITADAIKKGCVDSTSKNKKDNTNYTEVYVAYEKVCTKQEGDPQ